MPILPPPEEDDGLKTTIDNLLSEMAGVNGDSDEYSVMLGHLLKLYSLRPVQQRISPDTMLIVAGNLVGILLILQQERLHVVSSKALGFILRPR